MGGPPLIDVGRGGVRQRAGGRHGDRARGGTVATGEEDGGLRITPRPLLNNLQKGPSADFSNLIQAPGPFYKFQKNS